VFETEMVWDSASRGVSQLSEEGGGSLPEDVGYFRALYRAVRVRWLSDLNQGGTEAEVP
jgi:hypothetical protein